MTDGRDDRSTTAGGGLGRQAAGGVAWLTAFSLTNKLINTLGYLVLARLLAPADFGLVAQAYTVSMLANVLLQAGPREVLVTRFREFERLASPAAWMSLTAGVTAGVLTLALAIPAAWAYQSPQVAGLLAILAIWAPLYAIGTVPLARIQIRMQFGLLTAISLLYTLVLWGLTILLAIRGFGAYSFVIPWPIAAGVRAAAMWALAGSGVSVSPQIAIWGEMIGDSLRAIGGRAFGTLINQADYMALGVLVGSESVVGVYYFAYNLAIQSLGLLGQTLDAVLFPVLGRLSGQDQRQREGFESAVSLLLLGGVPMCGLQAVLAGPLIKLLFPEQWHAAIPVVQILSVGMAFRLLSYPAASLIQAQRRFGAFLRLSGIGAAVFVTLVGVAAGSFSQMNAAIAVAVAATAYFTLEGPILLHAAIRPLRGGWHDVLRLLAAPVAATAFATGVAMLLINRLPPSVSGNATALVLGTLLTAGVYLAAVRRAAPDDWRRLQSGWHLLRNRSSAKPAQADATHRLSSAE